MNNDDYKIPPGKYRHYKTGKLYQVIGFAAHSETHEEMVIYKALYDCVEFGNNRTWVRPLNRFLEKISYHGKNMQRFQFVEHSKEQS